MKIINCSIDLSKIDKAKIQTKDKNGNAYKNGAQYYNVAIILKDEADQYGNDTAICEAQSKAERDANAKRKYLGNGKTVFTGDGEKPNPKVPFGNSSNEEDSLPF